MRDSAPSECERVAMRVGRYVHKHGHASKRELRQNCTANADERHLFERAVAFAIAEKLIVVNDSGYDRGKRQPA